MKVRNRWEQEYLIAQQAINRILPHYFKEKQSPIQILIINFQPTAVTWNTIVKSLQEVIKLILLLNSVWEKCGRTNENMHQI